MRFYPRKINKTWRRKFAWFPIKIDGFFIWLEVYERRLTHQYEGGFGDTVCEYEHRLIDRP